MAEQAAWCSTDGGRGGPIGVTDFDSVPSESSFRPRAAKMDAGG